MPGEAPYSLHLLDQAIAMAEQEFFLLEQEDCTGLEESVKSRQELVEQAWTVRQSCSGVDLEALLAKLQKLKTMQDDLERLSMQRHAETRDELKSRKQASRAISGYGHKVRRTLQPMVITKSS